MVGIAQFPGSAFVVAVAVVGMEQVLGFSLLIFSLLTVAYSIFWISGVGK